jgi:serine/threonine-protein kinase RsbW
MAGDNDRHYELSGLAVPESLDLVHDLLARVRDEHRGIDETDLSMFETAIAEIHGNVVKHGRPPGQVVYAFSLTVRPDRLIGFLADTGEPAPDLSALPVPDELAESGRGMWLARATLDELEYARSGDRNTWKMVRLRGEASTAARRS